MKNKKTMTVAESGSLGGKARWAGKDQKARSRAMKKVRRAGMKLSPL